MLRISEAVRRASHSGGQDDMGEAASRAGRQISRYTYEEFLDYLQAKDTRVQRYFLPFHARNCVLSLLKDR